MRRMWKVKQLTSNHIRLNTLSCPEAIRQKWEVIVLEWKTKAIELFVLGKKINEISNAVGKSRRTLSEFFNTVPAELKLKREAVKRDNRKNYQRDWDKTKRSINIDVVYERVKRQHDIDVRVLSAERHF